MLRRLWISVFRVTEYPSIMEGTGKALGYLCLIVLLATLIYGVRTHDNIRDALALFAENVKDWPDFRLSGGRFEFDGEMPYIIGDQANVVIIDTCDAGGREAFEMAGDAILITDTQVFTKNDGRESPPFRLADLPISLSRDSLAGRLGAWLWPALIVWGLGVLCYGIAAKCLSALILALAGLLAAQRIGFGRAFNASIHALTGPIALSVAKNHLYPKMPFFAVIYWGWALAYVIVAVRIAVKEMDRPARMDADQTTPV